MTYQPQITIIGSGIVGLSTAYALLEQGMSKVRVLEQAVVNHPRATSSGISRLLRFEYGADIAYTHMVKLSLDLWRKLERRTQRVLYTQTGVLSLGKEGDGTREAYDVARELGLPSEILTSQKCHQRFPQFDLQDYDVRTFNSAGGILYASNCLYALKSVVLDLGGEIVETSRVTQIFHDAANRPVRLRLSSGEEESADRVVIAIGPWVHRLLDQIYIPVELTRQYILYFAGLASDTFGIGTLPAFMAAYLYGMPIHAGSNNWFKATSHRFGKPVDPDAPVYLEEAVIAQITRELYRLLPALSDAKLVHVDTCMYDVSPDEDFILDHIPDDERIIFATGLSGHGFKFGLLLGQLLSCLICGKQPEVPLGRFQLKRFAHESRRSAISVA